MRLGELKLGKSIEIYVIRDKYKLRLVSKIEDVAFDHIAVTLITGSTRAFRFQDNDVIEFIYKDDMRLWKWSRMTGTIEKLDDTFVHCFYGPVEGEPYNRRNSFRVFLGDEIRFNWAKKEKGDLLLDHNDDIRQVTDPLLTKNAHGIVKDLSESGAGIYTNELLELGDMVGFDLITTFGIIHCVGCVVRLTNDSEGNYRRFAGVNFVEVSNIISKYIFAVQRLQLKKHNK